MNYDEMMHRMVVEHLRQRLAREYKEITARPGGGPDLVLSNHGLVLAHLQVETERTITEEKAAIWQQLAQSGTKLILMVPKSARVRVMEMLWRDGIAERVGLGTYEISVSMP